MIARVLIFGAVAGLVSSTVYLVLALVAARRFRLPTCRQPASGAKLPPATVLKPLHGLEPRLEENLESFFRQDYPDYEIIFGARHASDPALKPVETLRRKYPRVPTRIILSGEPEWPNAKVFALEKMIVAASSEYLVITDSDVRVEPDCLTQVVAPLMDPKVGVVTCLYRGVAAGGFWSILEALGMSIEMPSGVFAAGLFEELNFALGPTMSTRKDVIEQIGGIGRLGSYCADDYLLGNLAHAAGKTVVLSHHIVNHIAMNTSMRSSLGHQVRWMRSTRFSRPAGHIGTGLTYAMPFGLLGLAGGLAGGHAAFGLGLCAWACLNRVVQALAIGWKTLGDRESRHYCWLYPLRDLLGFIVWGASFLGNEIVWRNERYVLTAGGKMLSRRGARAPLGFGS